MLRLVATLDDSVSQHGLVDSRIYRIGRGPDNHWILPSPGVSRSHASACLKEGRVTLEDLGSKNGLIYAGKRRRRVRLEVGGRAVQLGNALIHLEQVDTRDAELAATFGPSAPRPDLPRLSTRSHDSNAEGNPRDSDLRKPKGMIFGPSRAARELVAWISTVAGCGMDIHLTGESGVGKEFVARAIHQNSPMADRPYVGLNCAALPPALVEAELFGVAHGAATTTKAREGFFARADGGTLVLDEVGEMPLTVQAKVLRVLQERRVQPVGSSRGVPVDVRLISITHRHLLTEVAADRFRQDLYHRLVGMEYEVPPLRERRDDILLLASSFAEAHAKRLGKNITGMTVMALELLRGQFWSGNIRELKNAVEFAVTLCPSGRSLDSHDFQPAIERCQKAADIARMHQARDSGGPGTRSPRTLKEIERERIAIALKNNKGNKTRTAKELDISRQGLIDKMKRYGMHKEP